jgi:glycosyl transferase family 87
VEERQPHRTIATTRAWTYRGLAIALVLLFLVSVARFYHPGTGFTALIGFPAGHEFEAPAMREVPHFEYPPWASYDGQFYAQRALDPFCRDPLVDRAMDLPPFRARRILFSWTAYALGLGRPAWIIEVYAVQNIVCWLLLAWLLMRWMPPSSARGVALWTACLFSHGVLWSVRFALLDLPSLVLTVCAVWAVERERSLLSAAIVGISGLARETNVLVLAAQPCPRDWRAWLRLGAAIVLAAMPLLLWEDYLRSIYRSTIFAGTDTFMAPGTALTASWMQTLRGVRIWGWFSGEGRALAMLSSLIVQAVYVLVRREYRAAWWRVAVPFVVLMLLLDRVLADPNTGAITRILLPLTVGFNILLTTESRPAPFWAWFAAGNLHLLSAVTVMPVLP